MPKLLYTLRGRATEASEGQPLAELHLDGFIDAASCLSFERALDEAAATGSRSLLVDFSRVQYINSSGISALIRAFETFRRRGGLVCLVAVSRAVGLSMHLLGLTSLIPFVKDIAAGVTLISEHYASGSGAASAEAAGVAGGAAAKASWPRNVILRDSPTSQAPSGKVLVVSPLKSRFTSVLRRHFGRLNGDYHFVLDTTEAIRVLKEVEPDLIVLDHRSDPKGEFVRRVKAQRRFSLTSIIKVYAQKSELESQLDFKIWENDFLVDPFEMLELFSLSQAELKRVPKDRKVFSQQMRFEFKTSPENVEQAYRLSDHVIRQAIESDERQTALFAGVKEAIDNAVVHGNRSDLQKRVDVNFFVDQNKVTVLVEDEGKGFDFAYYLSRISRKDAFDVARRRILEEGIRGGLGILLMSKCTDRLEYSGDGNVLRLEKNVR